MEVLRQSLQSIWQVVGHELEKLGLAGHDHEQDPGILATKVIQTVIAATVIALVVVYFQGFEFGNGNSQEALTPNDEGIRVSALYVYPIKACAGIALQAVQVDDIGPVFDRRWLIVNKDGDFITQRSCPRLAQIIPTLIAKHDTTSTGMTKELNDILLEKSNPTHLRLEWSLEPGKHVEIPIIAEKAGDKQRRSIPKRMTVTVWNDTVANAADQGDMVSKWLSDTLELNGVRLVYMDDKCIREIGCNNYAPEDKEASELSTRILSFPDATPFMILSEESVQDLNHRLHKKKKVSAMSVNRFRPNILAKNVRQPYDEDNWATCSVGILKLFGRARCTRCIVTTTDQSTAEQEGTKGEPLATLREYRKCETSSKVCFGLRMVHESVSGNSRPTVLHTNDPVIVHRREFIGPR